MSLFYRIIRKLKSKLINSNSTSNAPNYSGACQLLEVDYGHAISKKLGESVDAEKYPIPWFTYSAIHYINQLNFSNQIMLEWGSGNSTKYFTSRVKRLYSIEHNIEWFENIKGLNIENHIIKFEEKNYAEKPFDFRILFDIILIDGIERDLCAKSASKLIKKGGVIILDNSDRHPDIAQFLRDKNFLEIDFHGFGPINDYTWTTSIFFHREANLVPNSIQPVIPIGGGY